MKSSPFRRRALRKIAMPLALAALALGVNVTVTSPASATVATGAVSGSDTYTDDWNDEGPVSIYSNSRSNATCLWQTILWADGEWGANYIDGVFGQGTRTATMSWQIGHGSGMLDVDGSAGPATWTVANGSLQWDHTTNGQDYYVYHGFGSTGSMPSRNFELTRARGEGNWAFKGPDGIWRTASYTVNSC
jgi:hypothetical protein